MSLNCHVDFDSLWMVSWDVHRNVETGSRTGIFDWRRILRCVARMSRLPEFPVNNVSDSVAVGPGGPDGP